MNVLVVVIDALRASDVGCFGRNADTTPNIDDLADESLVFERAFAQSNYTDICMSCILSGKTPREHGVTHHGTAHTDENLARIERRSPVFLPEILQGEGYETIGVDWMGRWHEWGYDTYGVADGGREDDPSSRVESMIDTLKDAVLDLPEPVLTPILARYFRWFGYDDFRVDCEELTDLAIERIDDADSPFFTLLHYWDVHPPYLPPDEFKAEFEPEEDDSRSLDGFFGREGKGPLAAEFQPYARDEHTTMAEAKAAYDGSISWVDHHLGRLIDYLEETGALDETVIVITADHGHNFGEHGIFSDNSGLWDTSIHVPLIIYDPSHSGGRYDGLVQHTDIVPTILDRTDGELPADLRGNALPATRDYVFAESVEQRMRMLRTDEWKLIVPEDVEYLQRQQWYQGTGEDELYNLTEDPEESRNVLDAHPDVARDLRALLEEEVKAQEEIAQQGQGRSVGIDEGDMDAVEARLEALGYADEGNV